MLFAILRSGAAVTVVGSVVELLLELGSEVGLVVVTMFVTDGKAASPTETTIVINVLAPTAKVLGFVQPIVWPEGVQVHPEPIVFDSAMQPTAGTFEIRGAGR